MEKMHFKDVAEFKLMIGKELPASQWILIT